jgi:DNA adenine methylase
MRNSASLFGEYMVAPTVTNVASVAQLSPFRYPGGKTWFIPMLKSYLRQLPIKPELFVEPFAGGGIASLTVAAEGLAEQVLMVEKDEHVAIVWKAILEDDAEELARSILAFKMSEESVLNALSIEPRTITTKAFQVILRNRANRGGIMATGASFMKTGEKGKGISSRWYPETLAKRIRFIQTFKDKITFHQGDAFDHIPMYINEKFSFFFIDPPYTAGGKKAGSRLYSYHDLDHAALFEIMSHCKGNFLMTYDNSQEVYSMCLKSGFRTALVPMKNTHHEKMFELLIHNI